MEDNKNNQYTAEVAYNEQRFMDEISIGQFRYINLWFDTIDEVKALLNDRKIEHYKIHKGFPHFDHTVVLKSQSVIDGEEQNKQASIEWQKEQDDKLALINSMPETVKVTFPDITTFYFEVHRGNPFQNPREHTKCLAEYYIIKDDIKRNFKLAEKHSYSSWLSDGYGDKRRVLRKRINDAFKYADKPLTDSEVALITRDKLFKLELIARKLCEGTYTPEDIEKGSK